METRTKEPAPAPEVVAEIRAVVLRAKQGDQEVLPRLHQLLDEYPALWRQSGDLAAQAQNAWLVLAAGKNLHLRECLLRQTAALRLELAGPSPSPVERLLAERVVACWLQLHFLDAMEAEDIRAGESPLLLQFRARRQEQAHRRYLTALAALTTLRRLLPVPLRSATEEDGLGAINGSVREAASVDERAFADRADLAEVHNRIARFLQPLYTAAGEAHGPSDGLGGVALGGLAGEEGRR